MKMEDKKLIDKDLVYRWLLNRAAEWEFKAQTALDKAAAYRDAANAVDSASEEQTNTR